MDEEKDILLLKGTSKYNVLREAADKMYEGFNELGYSVHVLDMICPDITYDMFTEELNKNYKFVFSFQALGTESQLFDNLDIPYFGWIVDSPVYHLPRINNINNKNIIIGCIDESHVNYIGKYYTNVNKPVYLPHAGFQSENVKSFQDSEIEVLFSGGYSDPEKRMEEINTLPKVFADLALAAIEMIKYNNEISVEYAVKEYFRKINFIYTDEEFLELSSIIQLIDQYIREFYRDQIIRSLVEKGIKVTVVGKGWNKFNSDFIDNINVLSDKGMDITEVTDLIANSKILLNIAPTYNKGMHERILSAMLNETVCFTMYNFYMSRMYEEDEEIKYIRTKNLDSMAEEVKFILNNPDVATELTRKAKEAALKDHTWKNRAEQIIEIMKNRNS